MKPRVTTHDGPPLGGRRVLVTRPRAQAPELAERLAVLGAEPIVAPAIRIVPPEDMRPLDEACAAAASFAWIVFTSANAVDAFLERPAAAGRGAPALAGVRICAIGPATAARLATYGLTVDLAPADHRGEGVSAALRTGRDLRGTRLLLPRADIARPALPDALRAAGAQVTEVTAYRTIAARDWPGAAVREMLLRREIDAVTFTSASAVRKRRTVAGRATGRRPAACGRRRGDRPGHGAGRTGARHRDGSHAADLHYRSARRGARGPLHGNADGALGLKSGTMP